MLTCAKCKEDFSYRIKIDGVVRNLNGRKFCTKCSPFGSNNRRDLVKKPESKKTCSRCRKVRPIKDFYRRTTRKGETYFSWCKKCTKQYDVDSKRIFKQKCVDFLGGKCVRCGYAKCASAFDFHHRDPSKKDFQISEFRSRKYLSAIIIKELKKCDLLCANCHREEHAQVPVV